MSCSLRPSPELLRLPKPQIIVPFSHTAVLRLQGSPGRRMVEYLVMVVRVMYRVVVLALSSPASLTA